MLSVEPTAYGEIPDITCGVLFAGIPVGLIELLLVAGEEEPVALVAVTWHVIANPKSGLCIA
jgi:hypothetical protein